MKSALFVVNRVLEGAVHGNCESRKRIGEERAVEMVNNTKVTTAIQEVHVYQTLDHAVCYRRRYDLRARLERCARPSSG